MEWILCLLLWIDFLKWLISFLVTRSTMLHMWQLSFVGKSFVYMECPRLLYGLGRQVLELLLEDSMRQTRHQASILFGISPTNGRPNGGDEPDAIDTSSRVDQEEHQGMGAMLALRRVRLQPQDIRLPASPPSRSSTASTRCPHWTFFLYLSKSAPTWTQVHEKVISR